jgi:hypothetical protein
MYTLSIAIASGLYPVCFEIGAQAERVKSLQWGSTLPLHSPPAVINDQLLRIAASPINRPTAILEPFAAYPDLIRDYYQLDRGAFFRLAIDTAA